MLFDTLDIAKPWPNNAHVVTGTPNRSNYAMTRIERLTLPEMPNNKWKTDKVKDAKEFERLVRSYTGRNIHGMHQKPPEYHLLLEFEKYCPEYTRKLYNIIPKMQKLLLKLPEVITRPPRLLKSRFRDSSETVFLSQKQCAHLLIAAFFSTFPRPSGTHQVHLK